MRDLLQILCSVETAMVDVTKTFGTVLTFFLKQILQACPSLELPSCSNIVFAKDYVSFHYAGILY
jgi:hypothetical protein